MIFGIHEDGEHCYNNRCALPHQVNPQPEDIAATQERAKIFMEGKLSELEDKVRAAKESQRVLRTPEEWSEINGVYISDPDGWRRAVRLPGQKEYIAQDWDVPMDEKEFEARLSVSTILSRRRPVTHVPPEPAPGASLPMKWADAAMYRRAPMPEETRAPGGGRRPRVTLINATPDPLGSLAQLVGIYRGEVFRSLAEISDDARRAALEDMLKTELNGPLEAIQFQFLVEGVTRSFTHQAVRTRASFFAQESLRFAVADDEDWIENCAYPPSLAAPVDPTDDIFLGKREMTAEEIDYDSKRSAWREGIYSSQLAYQRLIDAGVPAEDARGLMPHAITTRYVWVVSLRTLLIDAGKRLCTQAQFEWRLMMADLVRALREYSSRWDSKSAPEGDAWQFAAISALLQPVCYAAGRCTFMSSFDRGCRIRDRVEANAKLGRPSSEWHKARFPHHPGEGLDPTKELVMPIKPGEWLADPNAAR